MHELLERSAEILDARLPYGPSANPQPGELAELADGVALIAGFANTIAFRTSDGLVLFDLPIASQAARTIEVFRNWSPDPVHTVIVTHGHADHVGGIPHLLADAQQRGHPRPRVVGHVLVAERLARYGRTSGYLRLVNRRQFGETGMLPPQTVAPQPQPLEPFLAPDLSYRDTLVLEIGGLTFELSHARGETDDHTWTFVPQHQLLCPGDLVQWHFPNAGNPQKVQRYAADWAEALRRMLERRPELMIGQHGLPVAGADRIAKMLETIAAALEYLVEATLAMMNRGATLDEILNTVRVPDELAVEPYLNAGYDDPEFVIRNIWRLYGGWWDLDPATLKPAAADELSREVASLVGGAHSLAARAFELASEGNHRLASHLIEWAARAAPDDRSVRDTRALLYEQRAAAEPSLMGKGIFLSAARASAEGRLLR
jgi:alkyl sulfatase BDS1-like metallo-beta-lactamase superfamily hydrolase